MNLFIQVGALAIASALALVLPPFEDLPLVAALITGSAVALNLGHFRAFERLISISVLLSFGGVNHG
jgi:hypothetical protein